MNNTDALMLAVWQDVSRHLEIGESTATLADLLLDHLPLHMLAVCRCDAQHLTVRAVAASGSTHSEMPQLEATLSRAEWRRLQRWMQVDAVSTAHGEANQFRGLLEALGLLPDDQDWMLAPLAGEHGALGLLFTVASSGERFTQQHAKLLGIMQEPMSVALDNDARLAELATLRDAAEAEKQTLLRRLGRSDAGDKIVGEESGLAQVMQRVDLVSKSEVPVLILGETGTGKELVARAIHNRSERHAGPFLRVNCGAIPRELIDSQLFGHEKGSFTGANESRQGWFERADQGTLFLDEIGELPLDAQVRFLRVLQDGFVERVGGSKSIRVDVRVVAATHRDLAGMVQQGGFREDLWYRIAVFPILLPPLRDRTEDIPALATHFALRAATRFSLAPVEPTEADFELLRDYNWPGNIRELGAVIDRAAILGNGASLELAAALGIATPRASLGPLAASRQVNSQNIHTPPKVVPLNDAMRAHIEAALQATHGRVEGPRGTAKLLGINPHTLRARMRKLKIDWSSFRDYHDDETLD